MTVLKDLVDEQQQLANGRMPWEKYWRSVAAWVLPQTEGFDQLVNASSSGAILAVTGTPVAADRSKHIYDMTSLWAIDRLTAGLISLKTPESDYWHDLSVNGDYGYKPNYDETLALENLRDYMFRIRANPKSGFWPSHKAAMRSMCGFGDGWQYIKEQQGTRVPYSYEFMSLPELFPAVDPGGNPNRMFRVFSWTAAQVVEEFGDKAGTKVINLANDVKTRHDRIRVMHAVRPRSDEKRSQYVSGAQFASWYCLPDDDHVIGEGGFWEFPFVRYAWSNVGAKPFSEGPVAFALAEIQSINEMAKNELLAAQMLLRPPLATAGKNFQRLNFNAGAVNPGLINGDGRPLFAPLNAGVRPDFSQAIMEQRRGAIREALYLNLWQILVQDTGSSEETATKSMLRAQEKGEMLGPVGISLNEGLSHSTDREVGVLNRKGAFKAGSPLAMPESLQDADVAPVFTSPLDRLRRMSQVTGSRQVVEMAVLLEQVQPGISKRIDADEMLELAQAVLGAPAKSLKDRKVAQEAAEAQAQQQSMMSSMGAAQGAGQAMQALGDGSLAAAQGAEAAAGSPALQKMMQAIPQAAGMGRAA